MFEQYNIIHFIGIGGIGMSGISEVLHNLGYEVTGSDIRESSTINRLRNAGIKIHIGHDAGNIDDAHVIVVSSAINGNNPEVLEAKKKAIPVISRAEMLAELGRIKYSILIAGSHGKTTTTSLISTILSYAGVDPTVVIGGRLIASNSNAILGEGNFFVAEADESDGSFLNLNPTIAVATNIDREHLDFFGSVERLKSAFVEFLNKIPFYGQSILCIEDKNIRDIIGELNRSYSTYGFSGDADFFAVNINPEFLKTEYDLYHKGEKIGRFSIPLSGNHNILNSIASIAVATTIHIDPQTINDALSSFKGIKRRLEYKGEVKGVRVFDDYGHHPTEISMTLNGIRKREKERILVVFQPHRFSRTRDLFRDFCLAFDIADRVYLLDIYPAGEEPIDNINSERLYREMKEKGVDVIYIKNRDEIVERIQIDCRKDDIVITFGAGDVWKVGEEFLKASIT